MPAHSSIFTGLLPTAHGVRDNGAYALGEDAITLAETLRTAGYTTHAFVSALVLNRRYNLNQGFETYDDDLWAEDDPKLFMIRERQAPKTTDRFLRWLSGWSRDRRKPFFTWIHYFDPHQPYRPSLSDAALSASPYDAEIAGVDRQIGRVVETLRRDKLLENTLLIITADHGESLGEHGEKTHAVFVYDATVRIPLIVRYPRKFAPLVDESPVRSVDLFPTILSLVGLPAKPVDGHDLVASWTGQSRPAEAPQYSESLLSELGFGMAPLHSIREGGFKYIRAPRRELYDLRNDPHELHNVIDLQPRVAARLDGVLTKVMNESGRHAVRAAENPMTRETEESLRALGYLAPTGARAAMQGIDPKDGMPLYEKLEDARHLAQSGRYERSEALLLEILQTTPRNVSAINILGLLGIKQGDREKALRHYHQSLAVDATQFRIYAILGSLALTEGHLDDAAKQYRTALSLNPHFVEAMANLGFIEALRGHEREAEAWYRKGIAADPTFPRVHRRLGDLYYERQDYQRAYGYYAKTTQLVPSDVRAFVQQGNCARRLGRPAEAESLFRRAEALQPDGWVPAYNRACLYATTGRPTLAFETLQALAHRHDLPERLLAQDPDLATVRALPSHGAWSRALTGNPDDGAGEPTE